MPRKYRIYYFLLVIAISIIYSFFNQNPSQKNVTTTSAVAPTPTFKPDEAKVTRVIDGDTIELENGKKVRYIGIDTPELHHPTKGVQCFGKEAMEENKKLVLDKVVTLTKDVSETDRYGRLLRYVYVKEASSSATFINARLVEEGFAHADTFPPDVKYADLFVQLEAQARENNKGLWSSCPSPTVQR